MANTTQQPYKRRGSKVPTFVLLNPGEKKALQKLAVDTERSVGYYVRLAVVKFLVEAGLIEKPKSAPGKIAGAARLVITLLALSLVSSSISAAPAKLSDTYAKAALLAVKTIQSDGSTPQIRDGQEYVNRRTLEKIEAADVEAVTEAEQAVTKDIRRLYSEKLSNNLSREIIRLGSSSKLMNEHKSYDDLSVSDEAARNPKSVEITSREAACFTALDSSLRLRSTAIPAACSSIEVKLQ